MSREPPPTLVRLRKEAEKVRKAEEKEKKLQQARLDKKAAKAKAAADELKEAGRTGGPPVVSEIFGESRRMVR